MEIVNAQIEHYLGDLYGERHQILEEMESEASKRSFPIVGPLVGKLLFQLAKMVSAKRVFEMGSGYGYSAFWWALAMNGNSTSADGSQADPADGEILLTESDESNRRQGEDFLKRAGLLNHVEYHVGNALEIIDRTSGEFDIVFVDIDKKSYPDALEKAAPRVRRGGLLVADNVLWSGRVVNDKGDPSTEGIKEFNRRLFSSREFAASIVPIRDGVAVAYKL